MSISSKIHDTIEQWQAEWKDRLRGWALRTLAEGVKQFLENEEPAAIDNAKDMITRVRANPNTPPEVTAMLDKIEGKGSWIMLVLGILMAIPMLVQAINSVWIPGTKQMTYPEDRVAQSFRLDPLSVITAWRRDKPAYEKYFDDLRDQGWSPERIEALKFVTLFYPGPQDLVRWQAREVFEPAMIQKYGLDDELGGIEREPFYKAGMTDEQITNYWRAHWEHASWMQVVEMLHRGLVTEAEVYEWFRVVEIVPYWRDLLIQTAYTWPTRVDVRRWWDMRTIDESRLRELYSGMGYRGTNLDDYVRWTKVYTDFPYWLSRWQKGWVTEEEVRQWLRGVGIPEDRITIFIQDKIKPEMTATTQELSDLTKSEIYKGVKQGKISREEGVDLLIDLGKNRIEAEYLLDINVPPDEEDVVVEERKLSKADIKAGLAAGIISELEARGKLAELRYSPSNIDLLIRIFEAAIKPPTEEKQRQASKADIMEGVKKGVITPEEGYVMLTDIGFSPEASNFILLVKAEASPFSPINYSEFKDLTTKWRQAVGKDTTPIPEELKAAADELVKIKLEVDALERAVKEERALLAADEDVPDTASQKLKELQVTLNRARSELQRIQLKYNGLVAAWKYAA